MMVFKVVHVHTSIQTSLVDVQCLPGRLSYSCPLTHRMPRQPPPAQARLGVPLAEEKFEGPCTTISFLGIVLDFEKLEAHLPEDKLTLIKGVLAEWLSKSSVTKRELLSLIGHLSFAAKVVPPGRTFLRRMIDLSTTQQRLDATITLTHSFRKDLHWWHRFFDSWNDRSFLLSPKWLANTTVQLFTDSSGSIGYGAYFRARWFQGKWLPADQDKSIQCK